MDAAPPLQKADLRGQPYDLAKQQGKVVLVNVWATWCEPCKAELPELARLHRELGGRGFEVVAVNVDVKRKEGQVRKMASEFQLPFPVLLDPKNQTVMDWKIVGYPTSFVVGRAGDIVWRRDGMIFEHDPELGTILENALAEGVP